MQQILGSQIPMTFVTLSPGDLPEGVTGNNKYLLKVFSVAAKKAITYKWLQADRPTEDNWIEIIKDIHKIERLTFLIRLKHDLYIARRTKWIKCV